ncbi:efflux transporter outer membrane subunit [Paraburkholderia diazotrophica]|uniref:Efflux transporter, outer membrane factor (OMF) lipoprotein, NodT family n=1 Tax=Paraburkholderia diazotrophica TaxID=667676 RepID=A0A1H6UVQ3_9BURK|nr:efflux transporter outer membrane subunit [Paraburkholderia diazotrophica]SEI92420.1 efflux transporter, outer membrane factor (OMF) lipoprotein, NodT family [Paraburkholderia diazotrophica]
MSLPSIARSAIAFAAASLLTTACTFGPNGTPPAMPEPAHYGADPLPTQTVPAQGVTQQFVAGAKAVPQWWRTFQSDELNTLVDEGLRNSPTLAAADKNLTAAREQLRAQIGSNMLPSIDAGGQVARQRALGIPEAGPNTFLYNVFVGQLQAQYTFDIFGASRLANAALASRVNVQAFQFDAARRALAANIVTAAISASMLDAQVRTTERLGALANDQARDTQRRYELGAVPHSDLLNAQQSAASLAASLPAARQQLLTTRHALAVLLGRTPDQAPPPLDLASLHVPEQVPVSVPSDLLQARPDIEAADATLKAAAAEVGVATAQMFPSLTLNASMGQGGFSWPVAVSGAGAIWSLGASLTQPIFHGGALFAQRRAAVASYEASVSQYKQTVLAAFQNVADTLAALEHDAQALDAANIAAQTAQRSFDETSARYRLGAVPVMAARASEQQYRNARLDEIRYTGARLNDTAALFQAMGNPPIDDTRAASVSTGAATAAQ